MDINDVLNSENPPKYLYYYAKKHGRLSSKWERLFLEYKDAWYITRYAREVIKERWSEAEPILLESKDVYYITFYAAHVIEGRWSEAEPLILDSKNIEEITYYAKFVIKERWPEAEAIIQQDKNEWSDYCKHFNIKGIRWT